MSTTKVRTNSAFILFIKGKKGRSMTGKQGTKTMLSLECSATMLRALFRYINWSTSYSEWILNFLSRVGAMIRELTFHYQCGLGSISYCTLLSFLFHLLQSYSSDRAFSLNTLIFPSHQRQTFHLISLISSFRNKKSNIGVSFMTLRLE